MNHKNIIKSLPLLASVLGRKYGVQVRIGGDSAYTNGNVIQLPSLPLEADATLLGLIRGYIDHESAHIRATDFQALKAVGLNPLEKHIWNIIEDWRVENALAAIYPGCRDNFQWLIKHLFLPQSGGNRQDILDPAGRILEWLLMAARSWDVPDLIQERDQLRAGVEIHYPGLTHELEPSLRQVQIRCSSTYETIIAAREITGIIRKYAHFLENNQSASGGSESDSSAKSGMPAAGNAPSDPTRSLQSLQRLLTSGPERTFGDLGARLGEALTEVCEQSGECLRVAIQAHKHTQTLSPNDLAESRQATTALRTRLQALMQSTRSVRNHSGYAGTLNTRKLHTLATGNAKLFLRRGERPGVNTAVHMLLDASGSMSGESIALAGQACFAVASALSVIKGVNVGVTAFPGELAHDPVDQRGHWNTVVPILKHGEKVHSKFSVEAKGNTPMDSALWWVFQQMYPLPEPRKIILMMTDGAPDNKHSALEAIAALKGFGLEVYGIGIMDASIQGLLPHRETRVISSLAELAPAMFEILQGCLLAGRLVK